MYTLFCKQAIKNGDENSGTYNPSSKTFNKH